MNGNIVSESAARFEGVFLETLFASVDFPKLDADILAAVRGGRDMVELDTVTLGSAQRGLVVEHYTRAGFCVGVVPGVGTVVVRWG